MHLSTRSAALMNLWFCKMWAKSRMGERLLDFREAVFCIGLATRIPHSALQLYVCAAVQLRGFPIMSSHREADTLVDIKHLRHDEELRN